ncbi:MAG: hypothetical protein RML12_07895 [Xanthomonadales bacterium]|nr:hypothetical protein [Xanthomonadales bacterium]
MIRSCGHSARSPKQTRGGTVLIAIAQTVTVPGFGPRVSRVLARPELSVGALLTLRLAPPVASAVIEKFDDEPGDRGRPGADAHRERARQGGSRDPGLSVAFRDLQT